MSSYSDYANAASDILLKKGEAAARAKEQTGQIWGSTIANLGQTIPKQVQDAMAAGTQRRKDAAIQSVFADQTLDMPTRIQKVMAIDAKKGSDLAKEYGEAQKTAYELQNLQYKYQNEKHAVLMNKLGSAQNQSQWASAIVGLHEAGEDTSSYPWDFTPEVRDQVNLSLVDAKTRLELNKPKPPADFTLGEGQTRFDATGNQIATVPKSVSVTRPKTWAEIALDAEDANSPTQQQSIAAQETHSKIQARDLNPASVEYYITKKYGPAPTPEQVLAGHEAFAKSTARGTAAGDIPVKIEKYDPATGRTTVTYVPRSQAVGESFEKAPSATLQNRLQSAKAVNQTGDDIIARIKDPKVAAMLGPLAGRYNTVRDFLGDPPPELAELAGQVNSFAIAQMGVHGMRNAQAAAKIEEMLAAKFTPESLIAKIKGINDFGTHLLQNQGMSTGSPAQGGTGLPAVGSTFQGGKVLKVTPVP